MTRPLLPLLLAAGCSRALAHDAEPVAAFEMVGKEIHVPDSSPLRSKLAVTAVRPEPVRHELTVPAVVDADPARLARIAPPLAGRVTHLFVQLGETVQRGASLFSLESPELIAAESDYLKARSGRTLADRNLSRQRDLRANGVAAQKEVEQAESDLAVADSELERATLRLRLLSMSPGDIGKPLIVRAPIAGRVSELNTAPGQYQNDAAAAVMTVADLSAVWITASVAEKDLQRVRLGEESSVELNAYPGEHLSGRVDFIGDVLVPETRTVKVRIGLPNPTGRLKPGMFARVTLRAKSTPELVVPASALRLRGSDNFVFVEHAPGVFEERGVTAGETVAGKVSVLAGLSAGDRVVTSNAILLP